MKTFFSILLIVAVVLAAYPFLNPPDDKVALSGLPWQIEIMPDGSTQVFGIHIGSSRLADAKAVLGNDMEVAIIAATDEAGSLEMYYGHYRAGLLSGKLVILSNASQQEVKAWRENAVKDEYMASGKAKKYFLTKEDLAQAFNGVVTSLTFIPSVNLDEEPIIKRFGEPQKRIQGDAVVHYLYPKKGLHISLYDDAKEVLQYVAPVNFNKLTVPLVSPIESL